MEETDTSKEGIEQWLRGLQDRICQRLEAADGKGKFEEDKWERPGGGGGRTRVLSEGAVIEKGGVSFSAVHGEVTERMAKGLKLEGKEFYATGVSIVMHPWNPMVPIIHMNVRYFELDSGVYWFGGGIDLTPHYVDERQAAWVHHQLARACDKTDVAYYEHFKTWADDYFYIKHRKETRGIGGIFFDRLGAEAGKTKVQLLELIQNIGDSFADIYTTLMAENGALPYQEAQREWQLLRRGRYAEFNLVWDAGTKFGLETDGRTESILMSLPPLARWTYDYQAEEGSAEETTLKLLRKGIDWRNWAPENANLAKI